MAFKESNQDQLFLLPPSLHDFLPAEHVARVINEVANELNLRGLVDRYSDLGCSTYHHQMMLKILFYGYAMGAEFSCHSHIGLKSEESVRGHSQFAGEV